ncbi:MAG: lactate racemase domain-containing protein [Myxococcales bacterium]
MRPLLYSGTEVLPANLPADAQLVMPPKIGPGFADVKAAVAQALEAPVDGKPLAERVTERTKVLVVFDGPGFPVPPLRVDPRVAAIEAILVALDAKGLPLQNISLLCSSGVTRLFHNTEVARIAGVPAMASHHTHCHDAEEIDRLTVFGTTSEGEQVELNAALREADLVISLALAQAPVQGGWATLVPGLASVNCARALLSAKNLATGETPFEEGSRLQKALKRAGKLLEKKLDLFHVELALDTRLWFKPMIGLLRPKGEVPKPVSAWNSIPEPIRARASRLFRSEYQVIGVAAGSVGGAHEAMGKLLLERSYVPAKQSDIVVLGVPAVAPHTANSYSNPVLDVALAFGYVLAWNDGKALFKKGGTVILLNPLHERFDKPIHAPYAAFYQKVLADTREPEVMAEKHEHLYAGRPEYVGAYRKKFAFHGVHPFHVWYQAYNALSKAGRVLAVGAAKPVAARFGFETARSLDEALSMARETAGKDASVAVPVIPPAFGIKVTA